MPRCKLVVALVLAALLTASSALAANEPDDQFCDARGQGCAPLPPPQAFEFTFDESRDYNKEGIAQANVGDTRGANRLFRAASLKESYRGDVWANVGLSLHQLVLAFPAADAANATAREMLREALAAFDLGVWLQNAVAVRLREPCLALFEQRFPGTCLDKACARYTSEAAAMALVHAHRHVEAVNQLCTSADAVTVTLAAHEHRTGLPTAQTMRRLWTLLRVCGVVAIKDVSGCGEGC